VWHDGHFARKCPNK
jgi:hypothetical protein